jgi:non-specific serine/threonine protein kinase
MPGFLHVKLFGGLDVRVDGQPITAFRTQPTKWMLAFLALKIGEEVEFDLLAQRLWISEQTDSVRKSHGTLSELLGPERLRKVGKSKVQLVKSDSWVDVPAFEAAIAVGTPDAMKTAIGLYTGDLLEGCADSWVEMPRARRREAYYGALRYLAEEAMTSLDDDDAAKYLRLLIAFDRHKEKPRCDLMQLLARQGEHHAAIAVYHEWETLLEQNKQIVGQEMQSVYRAIQAKVTPPVTATPPVPTSPQFRLPPPNVELVGRERELAEIRAKITFSRLVTLKGPPGVGKTLLALHIAQFLRDDYPAGTVLVDLTDVTDEAAFCRAVASALCIIIPPPRQRQAILDLLRPGRFLLVLDNCEQIVSRGTALIRALLEECPYLHILATSRTAWRQRLGERVMSVSPLTLPPATLRRRTAEELMAQLPDFAAVRLFVRESANVQPGFSVTPENAQTIAQICRQLDGLPLAIRLLAGWAHKLAPVEMLAALAEGQDLLRSSVAPESRRHGALNTAIEVSYRQLYAGPKRFFNRLAVFQGGWSPEAAATICGETRAAEYLRELEERSLLTSHEVATETERTPRFQFLETIRHFARAKLDATADAAPVRLLHLDYYLAFAEEIEKELNSARQAFLLNCLERERGNLNAALEEACSLHQVEKGLRLAGALQRFWHTRGLNLEGSRWLERLLKAANAASPALRSRALNGAANLAMQRGDYPQAQSLYRERLAIEEEAENPKGIASTLGNLGNIASEQGDLSGARALYERSLTNFREAEENRGIAMTLGNLSVVAFGEGDFVGSLGFSQESIAMFRQLKDSIQLAMGLNNIAETQMRVGDETGAMASLQECLRLCRNLGSQEILTLALFATSCLAISRDRMEEAAMLFGMGEELCARHAHALAPRSLPQHEQNRALLLTRLGPQSFEHAFTQSRLMSDEESIEYALRFLQQESACPV